MTSLERLAAAPLWVWLIVALVPLSVLALTTRVPLRYNVRNIMVRWPTTLLTAAAFMVVVGLLVVMLAFVNGMAALTEGSGQPANVLILADGATDELFSNLSVNDTSNIEREVAVTG